MNKRVNCSSEYQRCIAHQVRENFKYLVDKDKKEFSADLKSIYHASNEEIGYQICSKSVKRTLSQCNEEPETELG